MVANRLSVKLQGRPTAMCTDDILSFIVALLQVILSICLAIALIYESVLIGSRHERIN